MVAADSEDTMNWLLSRFRHLQEQSAGRIRPRDDAREAPPDPYRGMALGVECAWLPAVEPEVARTRG